MSSHTIDAHGGIHSGDNGQFTGHLRAEADPGRVLPATDGSRCRRCGEPTGEDPTWDRLCTGCAEEESVCPDCGTETSGLNPAENGCPYCGGGTNDCEQCGGTGDATYRDDERTLCDDCYDDYEEDDGEEEVPAMSAQEYWDNKPFGE